MLLTPATPADFPAVCALYETVCADMLAHGLQQWHWGQYPNEELVCQSLEAGTLYVVREGDALLCAVTVDATFEPEYAAVNWHCGVNPGTFHRVAIAPKAQGRGLGRRVMNEIIGLLREKGCDALRADTLCDNMKALTLYKSLGMTEAGCVYYPGEAEGKPFICLEMPLKADCPLLPVMMHPHSAGAS